MSHFGKAIVWAMALIIATTLWLTGTASAQGPTGSAAEGQRLFEELGCRACHQLQGEGGQVGPALDGLINSQVSLADGTTIVADEAYLRKSIADPGASVVAGYADGIMPKDFGQRLSEEQLNALIAYISNPTAAVEAPSAEAPAAAYTGTEAHTQAEAPATASADTAVQASRPQEPPVPWQRDFIWIFAELHLILAAFLLGGPIFVVIAEIIGWRTGDPKYDRLAREVMRILVFMASLVGGFGALLTFGLVALYPNFTQYIFGQFFPLFLIYGGLIFGEIITLYAYYYSWDALKNRKGLHVFLGVMLNLFGTLLMFGMNGLTTFMMTPPKEMVLGETVSMWAMVFNDTFWPLNLHRLVANITLGGFLTGFYAAYRFLTSKSDEERAYYDWMGFVGNFIGMATMIILPLIGFIYANELSGYDRGYLIHSMAGALSWFFEVQGILIGVLFTCALYYMWLNLRRIEGGMRFGPHMKAMFALVFIGNAVWITPHHFMATMFGPMHMHGGEIPEMLKPLALMVAKNSAVTIIILVAFIAYMLYRRAVVTVRFFSRQGIVWGSIDVRSQYVLLILGYVTVLIMALMGFIRSQARRDWHIYGVMADPYTTASQPPTWWAMTMISVAALVAVSVIGLVMWLSTVLEKEPEPVPDMVPERTPRLAPGLVPRWAWLRVAGVAAILLVILWLGGALNNVLPPSTGLLYATTGALWALPTIFKLMYSGFLVLVVLFFRILDSPTRRSDGRVARNVLNMAMIPLVATGLFIGLGQISPQIGEFSVTPLEETYAEDAMPAVKGRAIFFDERVGCIFCHRVGEVGGQISGRLVGPEFTTIGAQRDAEYLRRAIMAPSAWAAPGFEDKLGVMPEYFAQRLSPEQIKHVVTYLTTLKDPESDRKLSEMMMEGMPGMDMSGMETEGTHEHEGEPTPAHEMNNDQSAAPHDQQPSARMHIEWQRLSPPMERITLDEFMITPLAADGQGGLWFGYKNRFGEGGVGHIVSGSAGGVDWQIYPSGPGESGPGSGFVLALLPDDQRGVWVGGLQGGLSHYDGQVAAWQTLPATAGDVMAIVADDSGLWIGTFGGGIAHYESASSGWTTYTKASTAGGLQDDDVVELVSDGTGGLWAGTYGGGVSHYAAGKDAWQSFTVASTGGGLASDDVRTLVVDEDGRLWAGTFGGGISRYDPQHDAWGLYTSETTAGDLATDYVLTLLPAGNGTLWAGLSNLDDQGGLAYFDGKAWRSYTVASTDGGLLSDDVRALAPDVAGGIWVGTRGGGLSHLSADHTTWTTFTVKSAGSGLAGDTVLALLPDDAGGLWVGTAHGLSRLQPADE